MRFNEFCMFLQTTCNGCEEKCCDSYYSDRNFFDWIIGKFFFGKCGKPHPFVLIRDMLYSEYLFQVSLNELIEPLDFEEFLQQHQNAIYRDPLRSILDFPLTDIQVRVSLSCI